MSSHPFPLDPMLDQATLPFVVLDGAGVLLALNPAAARLYGSSRRATVLYAMGVTQHVCGT
ncbi:MAG: hypothetical protein N2378_04830, partial [Chloroflexaceae bacterium]|nr:hypothetical protein [Chloroflexaceae bacterium]